MLTAEIQNRETHEALVQDYLTRQKRLQNRFVSEKIGEADLFTEAAKLFKPITAETSKQADLTKKEIEKVTEALNHLSAKIAAEADFNPIAALFGEENARKALPTTAPLPADPSALVVNADRDLDVETIRQYGFKPPSELDPTNSEAIDQLIDGINRVNTYKLGQAKKKAKTIEEREATERDIDALRNYRSRILLLSEGYKLTERKGNA